jgi:hypothetical protein
MIIIISRLYVYGDHDHIKDVDETIDIASIPGHIHALSFNEDGSQLAIAFADLVALVDHPFQSKYFLP